MSEIAKHWIDGEWVGSETVSESFRTDGSWTVQPEADAEPFPV